MSRLTLFLLGPPRIECDGVPMKKVDTRKAIALLAYLAITHKIHSRDSIITLLWPQFDESRARNALRHTLYVLNQSLEGDWLEVDRKSIGLDPHADIWLDIDEFHGYLKECGNHGHEVVETCPDCVKPLTEAVEVYRGDFLSGFSLKDSVNFDDWQFSQTQSLRSEIVSGLERLVSCLSEGGENEKAIGYGKRWLELDRADELAHRHLMELYAKTGQRTAALRQYEECVRVLEKELSEFPKEETLQLYEAIKGNAFSTDRDVEAFEVSSISKPLDAPKHNLPRQLTSFIGRKCEVKEVKGLLSTTYLLTLTGSGGCGKTRLALEVAADLIDKYADGVWLVELASLSDPALVAQEVASALDVSEQPGRPLTDTLSNYLKSKQLLLVLDNCEHLIKACATLTDNLLSACPNLKILSASREGLGIGGELTYQVPSLSTPDPDHYLIAENIREYEALCLFIERASFSQPTFAVTDTNARALAQICQRLDGIPLAIELAAARMKALTVDQILARLDDRFRLLTGGSRTALPRQQTLRATIDWSYNQLSEKECILLNRLSVFMGGWTLEAAEEICAGEDIEEYEVLDFLMGLVDKSLVMAEEASSLEKTASVEDSKEVQYRLLETVRQYSREKLADSGEVATLRNFHLKWYLGLAEEAEPQLHGPDQVEWLNKLEVEHDNMRAALEWSQENVEKESGLRLAGSLWWFWYVRSYFSEGNRLLEGLLAGSKGASASFRAKLILGAGVLANRQGDWKRATVVLEESLALYRETGDEGGISNSLRYLGTVARYQGDLDRATILLEESLFLFRKSGDRRGTAWSLLSLGHTVHHKGDYVRAAALFEESLPLCRKMGDKGGIAYSLRYLGLMAMNQGDYVRAMALLEECLDIGRELGDKDSMAWSLTNLGIVVLKQGDFRTARSFPEESLALFRELGIKHGIAGSLNLLGEVALKQGDNETARSLLEESLAISREVGSKNFVAESLRNLGELAQQQGDYPRAVELYQESMTLRKKIGDKKGIATDLEGLARTAGSQKQPKRASRLFGVAGALREVIGAPIAPVDRDEFDRSVAAVRAQLEEEAFTAAWAEGRKMSIEEAITYALEEGTTHT